MAQYISLLPPFEQQLLHTVRPINNPLPLPPLPVPQLYAETCGTQEGKTGTYGWAIGTANTILASGHGQCTGFPLTRFRCSELAILATLVYLKTVCQHRSLTHSYSLTIKTDNPHVLSRWKQLSNIPMQEWWPQVWTWPDIDTTAEILHLRTQSPAKWCLHDSDPNTQLHRRAQTEAAAATQDQSQNPVDFCMPHCPIYLQAHKRLLTSKEFNYCRYALPADELRQYYRTRHKWGTSTCDSVHWQAFTKASLKTPQLQHFVTKLCAKALPTNKKLAQREGTPPACPLCGRAESNTHLWRCHNRQEWKENFLRALAQHLTESGTNSYILDHITDQTRMYLAGGPERTIENPIGWDCMMMGFVPHEWSTGNSIDPISWSSNLIEFLWKQIHTLWKSRNDTVHRHSEHHRSLQEEIRARTALQAFYRYEAEVGPLDRDIFRIPWQNRMNSMSSFGDMEFIPYSMAKPNEFHVTKRSSIMDKNHEFRRTHRPPPAHYTLHTTYSRHP